MLEKITRIAGLLSVLSVFNPDKFSSLFFFVFSMSLCLCG